MSKIKSSYVCNNCGAVTHKWFGKCFSCGAFNSITEEIIEQTKNIDDNRYKTLTPENLNSAISENEERIVLPSDELNRILGGGLVRGSAVLIGGEPGIGKSTLLLQLAIDLGKMNLRCLYVSGEESKQQIKLRSKRLNAGDNDNVLLISENNLHVICKTASNYNDLDLIILDSIQTVVSDQISSAAGSVSQVRMVAQELIQYAKKQNVILVLVGHVTKEGQIAGPKVLEHMVDTVLYFESDQNYYLRILRAIKNRFGGINEIGVFEMTQNGLVEVKNASELFITQRSQSIVGSSVFATIEGSRPFLVEIQALLAPCQMPMPRRAVVGWDLSRLSMILAVLAVRCKLNLANFEVYLNVAGGFKLSDPAGDLSVAAAIISAALNVPLPLNSIFFGEISLSGEVRPVSQISSRINEARRLGFDTVILSHSEKNKNGATKSIKDVAELKNFILNIN